MRTEFRTLRRTICALALALLFVAGTALDASAQGHGRHRGWTQGRHRGWSHSNSRHVRDDDFFSRRRDRRAFRRERRQDRRERRLVRRAQLRDRRWSR
jgi:hypothetical protein